MPNLITDFQSLPDEFQHVIRLAQDKYKVTVAPLQLLVGGWSGAVVYLVSVASNGTGRLEHCILKLDRKNKLAKSDEITRHNAVVSKSTSDFVRKHIAELVFDRIEHEGAIAIFYRIAGQSLLKYRPLSTFGQQSQLKTIFTATNNVLLTEWNVNQTFEQAVHPQNVLAKWLSFRLNEGGNIERFLQNTCRVRPNIAGLLISGKVFPNPLRYARQQDCWDKTRPIDIATGFMHGDLNTNNILVKFAENQRDLDGYYLIDFALFKEQLPLLYDQRYLEMSYLLHAMSQVSFARCVDLLTLMSEVDIFDPHRSPIEMSGVSAVIASARSAFAAWVEANHPSLHDDLWGQYWLAGVAAGLAYCHKAGQPDEQRLTGLIYAAANLKRYAATFNLPLPTEVELLYDENQFGTDSAGTLPTKRPTHNLPSQSTRFIGRATHIAAIKELLLQPDVYLVTLIGPGGTGKTRLSIQAAQEVLDAFPDGVYFAPLADDTDANQFISRVAQQLDVREGGRPLLENVKDYLGDKCLLLVLDNFEQLVSAAPDVANLLADAPQLKILVTSRIALNLLGEHEFPVPPLDLPQAAGELTAEALANNESIRLFVERAQTVQPNFALTDQNSAAVVQICRHLDGLPLAIELAAARIKLLQPQAILTRLDDRLKLLTGGARDLPARQQTLRNTLEWSYDLLNEAEKTLFARLSVFVGGFSLESAEAICDPDGRLDILDGVSALVNNSLLHQRITRDGETRFGMLETIRSYALERLAHSGEMEALQRQHAHYFADVILNQLGFQLYTPNAPHWLNWLEREHDNIRATLTWCLTESQGIELAARMAQFLYWFWYRRGYIIEGRMWTERILSSPAVQAPTLLRGLALATSGILAIWQGKLDTALAQMQESQAIMQREEDDFMVLASFLGIGIVLTHMGRDAAALPLLEQARVGLNEVQPYFYILALVHLGNAELGLGNPEQAHILYEEALAEAQTVGENWLLTFALNNLGELARSQGQYDLARQYYEECQALLSDSSDASDFARFAHSLGYVAQFEGDYALAETQFRKSLTMFRRLGNRRGIAECLAGLAGLKARQGHAQQGATLLGAAESLLNLIGGVWWPADRVEIERNHGVIRSALDEAELTMAMEKGQRMTLDQAVAFASVGG